MEESKTRMLELLAIIIDKEGHFESEWYDACAELEMLIEDL